MIKRFYQFRKGGARFGWATALLWVALCAVARASGDPANHDTVIWISMDGMRSDYLDRAPLPFFHRMISEGASTRRSRPTFPSITFPSHCSQATGVGVDQHGISGNSIYDSATKQKVTYPADGALLQAEPIWLTATRQGVRTLVSDWPLSQLESASVHAAYYRGEFIPKLTAEQRLNFLLEGWRNDQTQNASATGEHREPLRLLMDYVEGTDIPGHKYGPDAPEVTTEMIQLDQELGGFQEKALAQWKAAGGTGHVYFLFTTDHGMSKVDKIVDLQRLLEVSPDQHELSLSYTGNIASVYFDGMPEPAERGAREQAILTKLRAVAFAHVYRREELPAEWHYAHPTRVGDLVVVLEKGYSFGKPQAETLMDPADIKDGPRGMHGYAIADNPEMYGPLILWRYPDLIGGKDLGEVDWSQIHPTVAKLLGIQPSGVAQGRPIDLP